eukprot:scaffold18678_cov128-Isochrysis_galbana.AAC.1
MFVRNSSMLPSDMPVAFAWDSCSRAMLCSRLAFIGTATRPAGRVAVAETIAGAAAAGAAAPRGCERRERTHSSTSRAGSGVRVSSCWHSATSKSSFGSDWARSSAGSALAAASASASRVSRPSSSSLSPGCIA